ncbi:glycosyltransferase family 2 protein [Paraclostridium tenue]|uniref:Glycosyltransferase family 2 protein n=1 Tax=Paraclostridium tenue TaxID=1737 RepID=A0ABN1LWZ5_9FIRM
MDKKLVSIITPVYNASSFIKETIQSVQAQTYENWEMILVDDCSKDNSCEIISKFVEDDSRIRYIRLEQNSGAAVARNTAIKNAKGRYIAFLDSDDIWYKSKLEKQIRFMQDGDIAFSFTGYELMTEDGTLLNKAIKVPKVIDYEGYLKNTIIGCLSVIIDKDKIGYFEMPNIRANQDMATWLYILRDRKCKAYGLNECLAQYRLVNGSISNNKFKAAKSVWNVYRNIENLSIVKSIYVFSNYSINAILKRV